MFSMILIDDESFQLNHLKYIIDWEKAGFNLEKAFFNPVEALEYLKTNVVDLVITDISMPTVSGIDIAGFLHHTHPETKVIFLSAYEDFSYAQNAISYGVFAYLVKPITVSALTDAVSKAYVTLSNDIQRNPFKDERTYTMIRQCFIDLATGTDTESSVSLLNSFGFRISLQNALFANLSVDISDPNEYYTSVWGHGKERLITAIENLVNNVHTLAYSALTYFHENSFDILIISQSETDKEQFSSFVNSYINNQKAMFKDLLNMNVSIELQIITGSISELNSFTNTALKKKQPVNLSNKTQVFDEVKKYIDSNYQDNITLDKVAQDIGFNPAYFSLLFKEHFGINFTNYLCSTRIDAAKKLLLHSDIKITAVYSMVGFSQHSYFSKQFKLYTGYTPVEFRNKYRKM